MLPIIVYFELFDHRICITTHIDFFNIHRIAVGLETQNVLLTAKKMFLDGLVEMCLKHYSLNSSDIGHRELTCLVGIFSQLLY